MNIQRAGVEIAVDWHSRDAHHRERRLFEELYLSRGFVPSTIEQALNASDNGEWVHAGVGAEEVLPVYDKDWLIDVPRESASFRLGKRTVIQPRRGRFYPRKFIAGNADIHADDMRPMRLLDIDDQAYTCDLNHPLAHLTGLEISARVLQRLPDAVERAEPCNDIVLDTLEAGPGFQALPTQGATDFFHEHAFARVDEAPDAAFYAKPRMVSHLDRRCSSLIAELYAREIPDGARVLDLMSSLDSHLPEARHDLEVTGLGMNAEEMDANALLSEHAVRDLNETPALPFEDARFDAVICTASVEYLVHPFAVFRDIARVCKKGAAVMVSFSDRWFPPKAISLWSEVHPFERMAVVLDYFRDSGRFSDLYTETVRGYPRPDDDKYADQMQYSDPVFFLRARVN